MAATEPSYDRMFHRLGKVRWSLDDIDFASVDKSAVPEDTLTFLRVNCLMELSSLYAVRMFLRDFQHWPDFCQFMSIWYYEEMKHYLVLREYLKVFGLEPDPATFSELDTNLSPAPWQPTLALHYCGELRLGMWYQRWSETAEEPVLGQIYKLISHDEFRHAGCYKDFLGQAVAADPDILLDVTQACKWMLFNPEGDKHPTTMESDLEAESSVTAKIEGYDIFKAKIDATINDNDEAELQRQVLTTLSRLSGQTLGSLADLARLTRTLTKARKTPMAYSL